MVVKWLAPAKESLKNISSYYKKEYTPKAAFKIITEIRLSVNKLKEFSELAAIETLLEGRTKTYRSLVVSKTYKVVYFIENKTVYVADIWDCRQHPETNKRKIKK